MLLDDKLNQHLRQILERPSVKKIVVELEEVFGNNSNYNFIEVPKSLLISIEYVEGMLIIDFFEVFPTAEKGTIHVQSTQVISKDRVKRLYFDDENSPTRLPFAVNYQSNGSYVIS